MITRFAGAALVLGVVLGVVLGMLAPPAEAAEVLGGTVVVCGTPFLFVGMSRLVQILLDRWLNTW